jgi:hypothetical protein
MNAVIVRRAAVALAASALVAAAGAVPAAAAKPCAPPEDLGWRSCLSTGHVRLEDGRVRLKRARPRFIVRYETCPVTLRRRTVAVRTEGGRLLDRAAVTGTCKKGVAKWAVTLRPKDADLDSGTVLRSFWTGVADNDRAPRVKLD